MKRLFFLISGFLITHGAYSQVEKMWFAFATNSPEIIRSNKIKREEVYSYTFNKKSIKDSVLTNIYYYDSLGYTVEEKSMRKNTDAHVTRYTNTYTSSGKLQKRTVNMGSTYVYEYDSLGNEKTRYEYSDGDIFLQVEQKVYNEKNQVIELKTKVNKNEFYISRRYYYNTDGDLSKTEALNNTGEVIYTNTYEYDKYLHKKTEYLQNADGKNKVGEYLYNKDNQIVKENSVVSTVSFLSKESTTYVDFNKTIENIYNPNKTIFESDVYVDGRKKQMDRHYYFNQ
jgi:hypothetical protein